MREVEIGQIRRHQFRIGQARMLIGRRVFRKRTGFGHCLAKRRGTEIGGAGAALFLVFVYRNADASIVGVLEALNLSQAGGRGQPEVMACCDLGLVHTFIHRNPEDHTDDVLEFLPIKLGPVDFCIHVEIAP